MTFRRDYLQHGGTPEGAAALGLVDEPDEPESIDCLTCEGYGYPEGRKDEDCGRCRGTGRVDR